jgi:hypothetical protein
MDVAAQQDAVGRSAALGCTAARARATAAQLLIMVLLIMDAVGDDHGTGGGVATGQPQSDDIHQLAREYLRNARADFS